MNLISMGRVIELSVWTLTTISKIFVHFALWLSVYFNSLTLFGEYMWLSLFLIILTAPAAWELSVSLWECRFPPKENV